MGLSTLSFYGRPQDQMNIIPGGFCAGIIIGAIYSGYSVATNPKILTHGAQIWQEEDQLHHRQLAATQPASLAWSFHF